MTYTVTGTVPTPRYDPTDPVFQYKRGQLPIRHSKAIGAAGRTISVSTARKSIADQIAIAFGRVFDHVKVVKHDT